VKGRPRAGFLLFAVRAFKHIGRCWISRADLSPFEIRSHATPIVAASAGDPVAIDIRGSGDSSKRIFVGVFCVKIPVRRRAFVNRATTTHAHRWGERDEGCHQKGNLGRACAISGGRRHAGDRGRGVLCALRRALMTRRIARQPLRQRDHLPAVRGFLYFPEGDEQFKPLSDRSFMRLVGRLRHKAAYT
jgi:hypothetical protein